MLKIKSFLDYLETKEIAEEAKLYKKNKSRSFNTKMPKSFFEHPIYRPLNEILICKKILKIIPRRWEELNINFNDIRKRDCKLCDMGVLKITNKNNYKINKNRNVHLAIPISSPLYDVLYRKYKFEINLYIFVQISRKTIQEAGYNSNIDIQTCNAIQILKYIFSYFIEHSHKQHKFLIEIRNTYDIDIFEFLTTVGNTYRDNELVVLISKLNNDLEKYYVNK